MSRRLVQDLAAELPWRLQQEVVAHAFSIGDLADELFATIGAAFDSEIADELIFVAGVRKVHGLLAGNFWLLDNSLASLGRAAPEGVQLGGAVVTRGSQEMTQLRRSLSEFEGLLRQVTLLELVQLRSYTEILERLVSEHSRGH